MAKCVCVHNTQGALLGKNGPYVSSEFVDSLLLKLRLSAFPQFVIEYESGWEDGVIALDDLSVLLVSCAEPPPDGSATVPPLPDHDSKL